MNDKLETQLKKLKVKCKCSHTFVMPIDKKWDICNYCGRKVYNNSEEYFKKNLLKMINKEK